MTDDPNVPPREVPKDDAGYFEKISQAVFQTRFSWKVIRTKWPGFMESFYGFDVPTVAQFTDEDVERLLGDTRIVRNAQKIEATLHNARVCLRVIEEFGSIHSYLRSMDGKDYYEREQEFSRRFKYIGPTGSYFFFWSVGEEVPPYEVWRAHHGR